MYGVRVCACACACVRVPCGCWYSCCCCGGGGGDGGDGSTFFAFEFFASGAAHAAPVAVTTVDAAAPLALRAIGDPSVTFGAIVPFELWTLVAAPPAPATQWTVLGEAQKYVAGAAQRFSSVTYASGGSGGSAAALLGAAGEQVQLMLLPPGALTSVMFGCTIGADGTAALACPASATSCTCG